MSNPDVSVTICSYNRADWLGETIETLLDLEGDFTYEVLVVDNASTDHTKDVVEGFIERQPDRVRYVLERQPGVSFARNRGVQESAGEWIAFIDDDELAPKDWLLLLLKAAKDNNVKCVGGGVQLKFDEGNQRNLKHWVAVTLGCTATMTEGIYDGKRVPTTGNMLVHKEIFEKIGLFRTDLVEGGEDSDLYRRMQRAGYEAWHAPQALLQHQIPPFRLESSYLRSTVMRMGSHIARHQIEEHGKLVFPIMIFARLGQTCFSHIPKFLMAKLSGDKETIVERQCYLWMWHGYFKGAYRFMFSNKSSESPMSFRDERQFAAPSE